MEVGRKRLTRVGLGFGVGVRVGVGVIVGVGMGVGVGGKVAALTTLGVGVAVGSATPPPSAVEARITVGVASSVGVAVEVGVEEGRIADTMGSSVAVGEDAGENMAVTRTLREERIHAIATTSKIAMPAATKRRIFRVEGGGDRASSVDSASKALAKAKISSKRSSGDLAKARSKTP